jgi:hypothetical protein
VISRSQVPELGTQYALISGVFTTAAKARQRESLLRGAGLQPYFRFIKG